MKVERKDVFDFIVTLAPSEFTLVKANADENEESIEDTLTDMLQIEFDALS